ncbi:MAG: TlpA family protein disulfide reductase [Acidobacteriota bacterium]
MIGALVVTVASVVVVDLTPAQLQEELRKASVPVVVNVWATWCRPCVEEFPEILEFARNNQGNVKVMLVSADFSSRRELVEKFLRERGVGFVTYLKQGSDEAFVEVLSPKWSGALPATFVFAPGGKLVSWFERQITKAELEDAVKKAKMESRKGGKT